MVPDLPYVRKDVPDGSEALNHGGFARFSRRVNLRAGSASKGTTTTGYLRTIRPRIWVAALGVVVASALSLSLFAVPAGADSLTDRKAQVNQQLRETRSQLNESSAALNQAAAAVDQAEANLAAARAELAQTRSELATAKAKDKAMAVKLKKAKIALAKAKAAVVAGQAALDAQKASAGEVVRDQYQQQTNLLPLAALLNAGSTLDLQTRAQWSTTLFDTAQAQIDRLTVIQQQLTAAKKRQAELEAEIATDRRAAAANLKVKKSLEDKAARQEAAVAQLVTQRRNVEASAAADVATDKRRYSRLVDERATVERRIAVRIAKERARQRALAAAAQRAKAAQRKAAAKAAASSRKAASRSKSSPARSSAPTNRSSTRTSAPSSAGHRFSSPVSAPITSVYGMRFHPVLHYWKLHDGTDFGAGCGTAIRAPYAGKVVEKYYNGGYGNRLMIDHGSVGGNYVTTGYNHAIRYTVGVGQHVSRGQVIGYVGTTGYSTGCHLHLMVWLNGKVVNPMRWF